MSEESTSTVRQAIETTKKGQLNKAMSDKRTNERTTTARSENTSQPSEGITSHEETPQNDGITSHEENPQENGITAHEENPDNEQTDDNSDDGNNPPSGGDENAEIPDEPLNDPDWGSYDDDKIKIQDGDIIDYLMKEWILESAAWCINKSSGFLGAALYNISTRASNRIGASWKADKSELRRDLSDMYHKNHNPEQVRDMHESAVKDLTEMVNKLSSPTSDHDIDAFAHIARGIGKRHIIMKDGKFIDITSNPPKEIKMNPKLTPQMYEQLRQTGDKVHINAMCQELGIDKDNKGDMKKLTNFYEEMVKKTTRKDYNKDFVEKADEDFIKSYIKDHPQAVQAFNKARTNYIPDNQSTQTSSSFNLLQAQANLFAEYYSQYKFEQRLGINQTGNKKRKDYLEALNIFWSLQQTRLHPENVNMFVRLQGRDPSTEIPPNDVLIAMAKGLRDKTTTNDEINKIYKQYVDKKTDEPKTLSDDEKGHREAVALMNKDLEAMEKQQSKYQIEQENIDKRRELVRKDKSRILGNNNPSPNQERSQPEQECTQKPQSPENKKEEYVQNMVEFLKNDDGNKSFKIALIKDKKATMKKVESAYDLYTGSDKKFNKDTPQYKAFQYAHKKYCEKHSIHYNNNTARNINKR